MQAGLRHGQALPAPPARARAPARCPHRRDRGGYGADVGRAVGRRERDAGLPETREHARRGPAEARGVDLDEVRLDPVELDRERRPRARPRRAGALARGRPRAARRGGRGHRARPRRSSRPGACAPPKRNFCAPGALHQLCRARRASLRAGSRAPSRGTASPCRPASRSRRPERRARPRRSTAARRRDGRRGRRRAPAATTASSSSSGQTRPPATLCVFSSTSTAGRWSTTSSARRGCCPHLRGASAAPRPPGARPSGALHARRRRRTRRRGRASAPRRGARPRARPCSFSAIWFAIVAVGRKSARSWPSSSATRSCSSLTVGSSCICSSPTTAAAIAARMPGGRASDGVGAEVDHASHCAWRGDGGTFDR